MRPQHITAENAEAARQQALEGGGFNEAAAYHCGKHVGDALRRARAGAASMRPQHITAENMHRDPDQGRDRYASMRPQHITAENVPCGRSSATSTACFNEAAAYHCGKPARPRHPTAPAASCFNEAAAYHCGKPVRTTTRSSRETRFNEAAAYHCGKPTSRREPCQPPNRFNEAAAYHCGKRTRRSGCLIRHRSFNEAAAYHCGKLTRGRGEAHGGACASMRPQHITAENSRRRE